MNIYIYGSKNFKKDIHDELSRSNIDYKLGDNGLIQDVNSLDTLKELIEDTPDDIFLIDDSKIIKDNLINSKIKFLKPKDGIEQQYLKDNHIEDFSVDTISDISKHILKKMKLLGIDDDEFDDRTEIEESISDIVKDAYNQEENDEEVDSLLENEDYELGDDLKNLLSSNTEKNIQETTFIDEEKIEEVETNKKENNMENLKNIEEITSLDDLSEEDIMAAFNGTEVASKIIDNKGKEVSIKLDKPEDIKEFLAKLLESKAIEITVKVKE